MPPNFVLLDAALPDVARLVTAMMQARDAVERRSWCHPREPTSEDWWADVLADPRARKRERRTDLAVKQAFYRLAARSEWKQVSEYVPQFEFTESSQGRGNIG
jgi:hypothetical protein